ncbi:MAG: transferase [Candidatus Omnitrophota bacterium]
MKIIYKNVTIGKNASVEEFVRIGCPPRGKKEGQLKTVIGNNCVIRSGTVIYAGNVIGNNFSTGHNAVIREENKIGNNISIGTLSCIEHHVKIRDNVRIHSQAFVPEYSILEEGVWIGPNAVLTNALHPQCPKVKECLKGPHIKRGAKIGANVTILPAVVVGEGALIGAGSVVPKDVPPGAVMCGNPAKVMKDISEIKCRYGRVKTPYGKR